MGKVVEERGEKEYSQKNDCGGDQGGKSCFGSCLIVDGSAGESPCHRVSGEKGGGDIGQAQPDQFPVLSDLILLSAGNPFGDRDRLHEADEENGQGGGKQEFEGLQAPFRN